MVRADTRSKSFTLHTCGGSWLIFSQQDVMLMLHRVEVEAVVEVEVEEEDSVEWVEVEVEVAEGEAAVLPVAMRPQGETSRSLSELLVSLHLILANIA